MLKVAKEITKTALRYSGGMTRAYTSVVQASRSRDIKNAIGSLSIDATALHEVITANRRILSMSKPWIREEAISNSYYAYGIEDMHREAIDAPLSNSTHLSDLICYIARSTKPLSYLEIGVSVGKNFWQVINACSGADLYGFDMDDIYPVVGEQLRSVSVKTIVTQHQSVRKTQPRLENFLHEATGNRITLLSGDEFDRSLWTQFDGLKFNLIFSDAMHTPEAVWFEWEMLRDSGLINEAGFTMIWDDLASRPIRQNFDRICADAIARFGITARNCCFLHLPGWIGRHVPPHPIGIVSSLDFVK
jgi:hypothetical protein